MRKYEIHLPLTYGDGKPIEQEKMWRVREDLVAIFGSFLVPYRRAWKYDGAKYTDLEDSALDGAMPEWHEMKLTWEDLSVLPRSWRSILSQWRGIYYIFDTSDRKGYVGSAYGESNLLGRWLDYAARGHGGNRLLQSPRGPRTFQFTILQRVSPDMDPADVIQLESSWKRRLHTYAPTGLNDNQLS